VPFALVQGLLHAPQWARAVSVFSSQPFWGLLSQLAKPAEQAPSVQTPAGHDSLAFARSQTAPQAPQLARASRDVSHPSLGFALQSPKSGAHCGEQTPATQVLVPFSLLHETPQAPQWSMAVSVLVSHPFWRSPSQLPNPVSQAGAHKPSAHDVEPCEFVHAVAQAPQ
jgi:hypothetical protein